MLIKAVLFIISLVFVQSSSYGESISGSEILRSQELIQEDRALRDKAAEDRVFVKKIVLTGADLFPQDKLKEITLPFEKKWLTKYDIQEIEELIKQEYNQQGIPKEKIKLSSKVIKNVLEITLNEIKTP